MILLWLPCVFLGVVAASQFPGLRPGESDDVLLRLLTANTNVWLAGILGAGIMACVMATDSQILAMSTMFTEDVFAHYGGRQRFGPQTEIWTGRAFVVGVTVVAYLIALQLKNKASIFELAIRFAFSGFAAMVPVMIAALYWRRSNNGAPSPPRSGSPRRCSAPGTSTARRRPSRRSPDSPWYRFSPHWATYSSVARQMCFSADISRSCRCAWARRYG